MDDDVNLDDDDDEDEEIIEIQPPMRASKHQSNRNDNSEPPKSN